MANVLCYDKISGRFFEMDQAGLDSVQRQLNEELNSRQHLSYKQVIDILNERLPSDKKLHLEPWLELYEVVTTVDGLNFEFATRRTNLPNGTSVITLGFEPTEEEVP